MKLLSRPLNEQFLRYLTLIKISPPFLDSPYFSEKNPPSFQLILNCVPSAFFKKGEDTMGN